MKKDIDNFGANCDILSNDIVDILKQALNIIKIAGPILAIGLGMLDFVKAIIAEDPDKEQKTAFKHFLYRIIAAVLLFLIPLLLAFMMDLFLKNKDGYNSDDPFCNVVDWDE